MSKVLKPHKQQKSNQSKNRSVKRKWARPEVLRFAFEALRLAVDVVKLVNKWFGE